MSRCNKLASIHVHAETPGFGVDRNNVAKRVDTELIFNVTINNENHGQ